MDAIPQRKMVTQEAMDAAVTEYLSLIQAIFRNGSLSQIMKNENNFFLWYDYLSQMLHFLYVPLETLNTMETFQWSNLVVDKTKSHIGNALFEAMCVLLNYALW